MLVGLALSVLSGILDGSTVLPMHFVRKWRWENIWLVFCGSEMILVPLLTAALVLPEARAVYESVPSGIVLTTVLFGLMFGLGNLLFGLGVTRVGIGLGNAIVVSLCAVNGSLIPFIFLSPEKLGTPAGKLLFVALGIMVAGILLCSSAARRRKEEKALLAQQKPNMVSGILICIASGFFSPCLNFAFAFGAPLSQAAVKHGAGAVGSGLAVLVPALIGAFTVSVACCAYVLTRNRTWSDFLLPDTGSSWFCGFLMGCFNGGAFIVFGIATAHMGTLGPVVGWPVYMAMIVVTANTWGWIRGEWRGCDRVTYAQLFAGIALIIAAICLVSRIQ
jgi:L-rhamnose-H+ transport protein